MNGAVGETPPSTSHSFLFACDCVVTVQGRCFISSVCSAVHIKASSPQSRGQQTEVGFKQPRRSCCFQLSCSRSSSLNEEGFPQIHCCLRGEENSQSSANYKRNKWRRGLLSQSVRLLLRLHSDFMF